jgi:glutamyl/glutaminyl-tRNA synthetase
MRATEPESVNSNLLAPSRILSDIPHSELHIPNYPMSVRTRFAPSPTGYLHIGGVRTALFNWLFARKHGGQFILRIDDTDQGRNQPEALQPILDGFKWLGLDWDEGAEVGGPYGPYYQSQRLDRYQAAVKTLLDKGLAYWDYATPDETKAEMQLAEKEKRPKIYSRRWMAESAADRARFEAEGRTGSVKIKMPREGVCKFYDHVRKDVEVQWAGEQDIVIQRSDGTVTYNLANVVDDFDMKITHVIRAEEHLSNTPRQIFMLEGLGYPRPEYAHVPFVAEPGSKNKLSKRKIAQYLKNADFKKVYAHAVEIDRPLLGFEIARRIKCLIEEGLKQNTPPGSKPSKELIRERGQPLLQYLTRVNLGLSSSVEGDGWEETAAESVLAVVQDYWDNPALLDVYEAGKKVLVMAKAVRSPETYNPVLIDFYREVGYLPAAILNYLVLLGWATADNREDFTLAQMVREFSLERVVQNPASLDVKKLFAFQARYMQALPVAEKVELVTPFLTRAGLPAERDFVTRVVEAAGPRLTVAGDILDYDYLFLPDKQIAFDAAVATKNLGAAYKGAPAVPALADVLAKLRAVVAGAEPFAHDALKAATEALATAEGAKAGPLSQVLRVAATGREVGFSAYDTLAVLGRARCLARIDSALRSLNHDAHS